MPKYEMSLSLFGSDILGAKRSSYSGNNFFKLSDVVYVDDWLKKSTILAALMPCLNFENLLPTPEYPLSIGSLEAYFSTQFGLIGEAA